MPARFKWYGEQWKAAMRREARQRNSACALAVWQRAKLLIGTEGAGARVKVKGSSSRGASGQFTAGTTEVVQNRGGRKAIGKLIYGAFPSAPGDPPHKQTVRLLASVAWELVGDAIARVGMNLRYGRWLELGTRKMAARPWLRRALREMTGFCQAVWNRPWKGPM
jgi:hypothetical protein